MHNVVSAHISPKAIENLRCVLASGWLNEGPMVKRFERGLSEILGIPSPLAVSSDTAAMHMALCLARVGPGDEVILSPQTFIATGTVILQQGATPVFVDVEPTTGAISAKAVRERVGPKTAAIMAVHWGGYPCDLDELNEIAGVYSIPVIEDAAQALGASYKERRLGTVSEYTCFSFQSTKMVSCGEGGAICCKNPEAVARARAMRWFGIDRDDLAWSLGERDALATELGFKYHMNDVAAAIGLANLENLNDRLAKRHERANYCISSLSAVEGLRLPVYKADREHAYWFFSLLVEGRENFIRKLREYGINPGVVHRRIDRHPVFGGITPNLPGQEYYESHHIALPLHEGLTDDDVERMVKAIQGGW